MMSRALRLLAVAAVCAAPALAQTTPAPSHVERFSTLETRAERVEAEANRKLAADPNDAPSLHLRGLARMSLGRYAEANEDFRRAVALRPTVSEYQSNLGFTLWKLGRSEESVAALRAALRLDDKNVNAHFQLGRFLVRLGGRERLTEAVGHLRRVLELDARQYEVRFEMIAAFRALGDAAEAGTQLDLLMDARPSDPRVFYTSALLAADRDDLAAALKDFKEALRRDPSFLAAWRDLGLAHAKLARWPEAVEAFAELARRQADSVEAAYLHALALYNAGRAADAERESRRALRLNAGAAEAHTLLGVVLASRGDASAEAAEVLSQAATLNPKSFDARFYLGRVLYALKDHAGAAREFRAAVELNPRHAEARFFLGTVLESAGDSQSAAAEYEALVKLDAQSAMGQLGLGALLLKRGQLAEAVAALRRAATLAPKNFEAHWALGRALALAERHAEAVEVLTAAVSLAPQRADAHYQLGLALRRVGRAEEAAREFGIVDQLNTQFRTGAATRP